MNLPAPAVIWLDRDGLKIQRIAAFTWQTKTGLAWVEPGYLDGTTHAYHEFDGSPRQLPDGILFTGSRGLAIVVGQEEALADPDLCPPNLRKGLAAVQDDFARMGLDWAAEFARLTQSLADDLGGD